MHFQSGVDISGISITDQTGLEVWKSGFPKTKTRSISLPSLKPGTYLLKYATSSGTTYFSKLLVH